MRRKIARDGRCQRTGKVRYRDEHSAKAAMRELNRRLDAEGVTERLQAQRVYPCEWCKGWHWTSREERP